MSTRVKVDTKPKVYLPRERGNYHTKKKSPSKSIFPFESKNLPLKNTPLKRGRKVENFFSCVGTEITPLTIP